MGLEMDLTDLAELFSDWDNDITESGLFIVYDGRQSQLTQDFDLLKGDLIMICKPGFEPAMGTTMLFRDQEYQVLDETEPFPLGAPDFHLFRICYLTQYLEHPITPQIKVFADPEGFEKVIVTMHAYSDTDPVGLEKIFRNWEVWRSENGTLYHCIGSPKIGYFEDNVVTAGTLYYYKAVFIDRYGRMFGNYSAIKTITAPTGSYPLAISQGWISPGEMWIYSGADSPTFTFTIAGDVRYKYSPGMRIKLTQSAAIKYFIITAVSYSAPNTIVTVYGGTDYTLANATIYDNAYSYFKAPYGFPVDPAKWTVTLKDTSDRSQASPAAGTWYNLGSLTISIPIGSWNVFYQVHVDVSRASTGLLDIYCTLSTANNSESDNEMTAFSYLSSQVRGSFFQHKRKTITVASKTSYYLNAKTAQSSISAIKFLGATAPTLIRAVCAYL